MVQAFGRYVGILGDAACRPGWQANFPRMAELLWKKYRPSHVFVPGDVSTNGKVGEHEEILQYCRRHPWEWVVAIGDHDLPFIGVDTSDRVFSEGEALWLREQIKEDSIIYTHMPPEMTGWKFHSLYPECTQRFFTVLDDFHDKIRACFFGHIHSYDRKEYRGIPLIVTGAGGAEARGLGANGYEGNRPFQAMAFDTVTGEIQLLEDAQ
jgi:predicted phosphohydrolase